MFGLASLQYLCTPLKRTRYMIQLSRSKSGRHRMGDNWECPEDIERNDERWCGGDVRYLKSRLAKGMWKESDSRLTHASKSHVGNTEGQLRLI